MSTPSNLYAEKVFSEHPIALWALDDKCDYISYVSESNRRFYDYTTQWLYTGMTPSSGESGTVVEFSATSAIVDEKFVFQDSAVTKITPPALTVGQTGTFTISSRFTIDVVSRSFSVALYQYSDVALTSVEISATATGYSQTETFSSLQANKQNHLCATFSTTEEVNDITISIEITYPYSATATEIYLNGFSIGSFSEEFSATSLGIDYQQQLPTDIALSQRNGVKALAYGSEQDYGYYLLSDTTLLAKNSSIPMVYGASNSTILHEANQTEPHMILPGKGFMNEKGKTNTLTLEAWLRINSNNASERIIGPIASEDGLYVDGPFLVLRIDDKTCSHFVGEWFRPMLVDVIVSKSTASLMVNGESVASIDLSDSTHNYASPEDSSGKSQDWIGFYCYGNVTSVEVDCVAIYPYEVSEVLAKKRFVSGQGVVYPQDINVAYSGESIFIDYIYSNYAKNYEFPTISSWQQGFFDNLDVSSKKLSSPTYQLPSVSSSGGSAYTISKLQKDLNPTHGAISLKEPSDWSDKNSYLYFPSLNILQTTVSAILGIFYKSETDSSTNRQTLIKIVNTLNDSYVRISLEDETLRYSYKVMGQAELTLDYSDENETVDITKGDLFSAGINISKISEKYPELKEFFSNRSSLSVMIAGDYSGTDSSLDTTFSGRMSSISFCTEKNVQEFDLFFSADGILDTTETTLPAASYSLVLSDVSGVSKIEVSTKSYWQSHVPLSSLSKLQTSSTGVVSDGIDFVQINLDYPQTRPTATAELDPRLDDVKTFVTFQYISDGANKDLSEFTSLTFDSEKVFLVEPGSSSEDWTETKYQVIDGTIVYPPELQDGESYVDIALCIHMEIVANNSLSNKLVTRFLKLGSQSLSNNASVASSPINKIGTKFGKGLYPYKENATNGFPGNISYKAKNPFRIFRGSGPHLYLTHNSGISVAGEYDSNVNRGLFARLNRDAFANTNISSLQMSVLWNNKLFPETPQKIFEIDASTGVYNFYVEAVDGLRRRGKITVTLTSGTVESGTNTVFFYWNGNVVTNPVMTLGEWGMLGIVFKPYLVFNNSVGYIKFTSPMIVNNLSTYQLDSSSQAQQIVYKTWQDIEDNPSEDEWDEWYVEGGTSKTWEDAFYKVATFNPSIDPAEIYKTYIGTNKIIADSSSQSGQVRLNKYEYVTYGGVQRDSYPVGLL